MCVTRMVFRNRRIEDYNFVVALLGGLPSSDLEEEEKSLPQAASTAQQAEEYRSGT